MKVLVNIEEQDFYLKMESDLSWRQPLDLALAALSASQEALNASLVRCDILVTSGSFGVKALW